MVRAVMPQVDPRLPVKTVRATRGKWLRAEPVAALYAQGRVRHVGAFAALEDEMCRLRPRRACRRAARPTGSTRWSGRSTAQLTAKPRAEPRIRSLGGDGPLVPGWAGFRR